MINQGLRALKIAKNIKKLNNCPDEQSETIAADYITELLNDEKGIFFKIIQYMGVNDQAKETIKNLSYRKKEHSDHRNLYTLIEKTYGASWDTIFSSIALESYSASLAEVYPAILRDGTKVVLKVQYPDIKKIVKSQLKLLGLLPMASKFGPTAKWDVDIAQYIELINSTLDSELDYQLEVANQLSFLKNHEFEANIITSKIYPEYVKPHMYIQSFMEGDSVDEVVASWTIDEKRQLGQDLLKSFLISSLRHGHIQGDTNHGNFLFQRKEGVKIVYLDFGNFIKLDKGFRKSFFKLILDTINNEDLDPMGHLVHMGLDQKKLSYIHPSLPLLCQCILRPFSSDYAFDLKLWDLKHEIDMILAENKWWFRSAGSQGFFSLMKSFLGVKNLIQKLGIPIQWKKIFLEVTDEEQLKWRDYTPTIELDQKYSFQSLSKQLKIQVSENGRSKVELCFPVATFIDLNDFMDDSVKEQLVKNNVDLKSLIQETMQKGCLPGDVFKFEETVKQTHKVYHVWLE